MQSCCVIGCGPAGIAACAHLKQAGLLVTCFEVHSAPGGIWQIDSHEAFSSRGIRSPIHPTMRCIIPKDFMAFSDFRFDYIVPQFPHHSSVKHYLERYAASKGVAALTRFNTQVQSVRFDACDNLWRVVTVNMSNGDVMEWAFNNVCVCTGQSQEPRFPKDFLTLVASFKDAGGEVEHACYVKKFRSYRNKKVVVIGDGATAVEYCNSLLQAGATVYHSSLEIGQSMDSQSYFSSSFLSKSFFGNAKGLSTGTFLEFLRNGHIDTFSFPHDVPHLGSIVRSEGKDLVFRCTKSSVMKPSFAHSSRSNSEYLLENVDVIICSTGYIQRYPFLSFDVRHVVEESTAVCISDGKKVDSDRSETTTHRPHQIEHNLFNTRGLYLGTIYRKNPSLAFIGIQPGLLPSFLMFECQSRFVSYILSERVSLPKNEQAMISKQKFLEFSCHMSLDTTHGLCNASRYYNVLQQELGMRAHHTYTKTLAHRKRWFFASSVLRLYHKIRSLAPLKRKKQHVLFSNDI